MMPLLAKYLSTCISGFQISEAVSVVNEDKRGLARLWEILAGCIVWGKLFKLYDP